MNEKWDQRFLGLAATISTWSKDSGLHVGAVIVDKHRRIVSLGYNGFPRKMIDDQELLKNREEKLNRTIHAEMNALLNSTIPVKDCTMYVYPIMPCHHCALHIIQSGIQRVVSYHLPKDFTRWEDSVERGLSYFDETVISTCLYPTPLNNEEDFIDEDVSFGRYEGF